MASWSRLGYRGPSWLAYLQRWSYSRSTSRRGSRLQRPLPPRWASSSAAAGAAPPATRPRWRGSSRRSPAAVAPGLEPHSGHGRRARSSPWCRARVMPAPSRPGSLFFSAYFFFRRRPARGRPRVPRAAAHRSPGQRSSSGPTGCGCRRPPRSSVLGPVVPGRVPPTLCRPAAASSATRSARPGHVAPVAGAPSAAPGRAGAARRLVAGQPEPPGRQGPHSGYRLTSEIRAQTPRVAALLAAIVSWLMASSLSLMFMYMKHMYIRPWLRRKRGTAAARRGGAGDQRDHRPELGVLTCPPSVPVTACCSITSGPARA